MAIKAMQRLAEVAGKSVKETAGTKFGAWLGEKDGSISHKGPYLMLSRDKWKADGMLAGKPIYVAYDSNMKMFLSAGGKSYPMFTVSPDGLKEAFEALKKFSSHTQLPSAQAIVYLYTGESY